MESLDPKVGRKMCVEKEGAEHVICCADHAFSFTVLRRSIRTREAERGTPVREKITE